MSFSQHLFRVILPLALAFAPAVPACAAVVVSVDKASQQMIVTVNGQVRWIWKVSTGKSGHATPSGSFTAFRMEEDHFSQEWDGAPMPHSIFFTEDGHAIHGSLDTRRLGSAASHGCVRLAPANAAKLYAVVVQEGLGNTKIVVFGQRTPADALRKREQRSIDQWPAMPAPYGRPEYGRL